VEIGNYCNISQNVTIGSMKTMSSEKYPRLGNSVYLAPGSKILGEIVIGDEVAIGANTVVTENIPDKAVFVGNPGKIVSYDGTKKLVTHILK
jgi:serine O-acetyltransferase